MIEQIKQFSSLKRSVLAKELYNTQEYHLVRQDPIAVIGMGFRFPGGSTEEEFWETLCQGKNVISEVPKNRWKHYRNFPKITWGGYIDNFQYFDPLFFGISPIEAQNMDPQQKILLELSWDILENSGQMCRLDPNTGVFIGHVDNDYNLLCHQYESLISPYTGTGRSNSILANRISYIFDIKGPSISIDTACSSSLVAVHLACQSLKNRECNMALAGGVMLMLSPHMHVLLEQTNFLSLDGQCKTFDREANGYVRGEGVGLILLKRFSDAVSNNDNILAVIRGSSVNQDGRTNGIFAPNSLAQEAVIQEALKNANVSFDQVSYIETHGTGTAIGDAIELEALKKVYGKTSRSCFLGALKTNIGHLEAAAGIAGVIKAILCLKKRKIPQNLHLKNINPDLGIENTRFCLPRRTEEWQNEGLRYAAVSSFGFGGTNGHVILEEFVKQQNNDPRDQNPKIYPISGHTQAALRERITSLEDTIHGEISLRDISYKLCCRSTHHDFRNFVVGSNREEILKRMTSLKEETPKKIKTKSKICFLLFKNGWMINQNSFDRDYLQQLLAEIDLKYRKHNKGSILDDVQKMDKNCLELPLNITLGLQIAYIRQWQEWGITPDMIIGDEIGKIGAAYAGGLINLEHIIKIIASINRKTESLQKELDHFNFSHSSIPTFFTSEESLPKEEYLLNFNKVILNLLTASTNIDFIELGNRPQSSEIKNILQKNQSLYLLSSLRDELYLKNIGQLYQNGHTLKWENVSEKGNCINLPFYPFQKDKLWQEPIQKYDMRGRLSKKELYAMSHKQLEELLLSEIKTIAKREKYDR